jgi:formyltetrahydrofolate synthetase
MAQMAHRTKWAGVNDVKCAMTTLPQLEQDALEQNLSSTTDVQPKLVTAGPNCSLSC